MILFVVVAAPVAKLKLLILIFVSGVRCQFSAGVNSPPGCREQFLPLSSMISSRRCRSLSPSRGLEIPLFPPQIFWAGLILLHLQPFIVDHGLTGGGHGDLWLQLRRLDLWRQSGAGSERSRCGRSSTDRSINVGKEEM